eukprot:CAMPEP_0201991930 /NCGR_PEP_ID=MMETSP0905-20130828/661_1 /ASSEMBLY_ACC=CAM_ASM_000554 /TAXON_ID=420261 /ORGANISM="Thalassiosira antarctica, Strain CCMP982" /LENGTH=70 /DNA_ID=CAMNT_0048546481 /DNA_START=76 /DNA_END=285 /DNA_ORIENTATION=+
MKTFTSAIFLMFAASVSARTIESHEQHVATIEEAEEMPLFGALDEFVAATTGDKEGSDKRDGRKNKKNKK